MSKVLVTSALLYANGPLHFGHIAGAYLPADCYARYERLKGSDVLYVCGSDEYGIAITLSAEKAGRSPKEHVDKFHAVNEQLFKQLDFSFDHFSRTSWEGHVETVQQFFLDLLKNGYIEEKITDQLYSEKDQKFLADRYVVGTCPKCGFEEARGDECPKCGASYEATDLKNPRSKLTDAALVLKPTKHWFLRFDLFKDKLTAFLKERDWKENVVNFAQHYVDELKPRAITRDMSWGVPLPIEGAEGKVLYVWFDAPIGYISATKDWAQHIGRPEAWKDYWLDPRTRYVQFIGKDNIPFHAVFFPAMQMGQDIAYKLVDELPANEFYNLEGRQFSKSDGWYIDLEDFFKKFSSDQIRYAIASNAPETQDSEFTWKDFQSRCNAELLGKYGNFVNRTMVFAKQHCEGAVPEVKDLDETDQAFVAKMSALQGDIDEAYAKFRLRKASQLIMELSQVGNVYFDAKKPWKALKEQSLHQSMMNTIGLSLRCIALLATVSSPVMPKTAKAVWKMLGMSKELVSWRVPEVRAGQKLGEPVLLFSKVEDEVVEQEIAKLKEMAEIKPSPTHDPLKDEISIEPFQKIDLRVGQILEVERVPKSKKMLKMSIDLGFEKRTILSGIGAKTPELDVLLGKKVLVVANLKPVKLMGIESQGMVLAAETEQGFDLPSMSDAALGSQVT